jgi:hypothetical protein
MNYHMKLILSVLPLIIVILFTYCGCSNHESTSRNNDEMPKAVSERTDSQTGTNHQITASLYTRYSLSAQRFNDIRAGNQLVQQVIIDYSTYLNPDQDGYVTEIRSILLQLSYFGDGVNLNTIPEYDVYFDSIDSTVSPSVEVTEEDVINASDINTHIFDYLTATQDNIDYFFSGEEFSEVGDPYTGNGHINPDDYAFTLSFVKPGVEHDEWIISKSVSAEDLANEPILAGLINIMETEFMSRFED